MRIICFGDSNTYGYDPRDPLGGRYDAKNRWVEILAAQTGWQVRNRGENGRQIPHRLGTVEQAVRMLRANGHVDALVVMLGTNDILQGASAEDAAERMDAFLEQVLPLCGRVLLVAPTMDSGEWVTQNQIRENGRLGAALAALASRRGMAFADASSWPVELAFDGVHLTEAGHRCFAEKILEVLQALLPERGECVWDDSAKKYSCS